MATFTELLTEISDKVNRGDQFNSVIASLICDAVEFVEKDYTYLYMEKVFQVRTPEWTPPKNVKAVLGAAHTKKCLAREHYTIRVDRLGTEVCFDACPAWVKVAQYSECGPDSEADIPCGSLIKNIILQDMGEFLEDPETFQISEFILQRKLGAAKRADEEARFGAITNGSYAGGFTCCQPQQGRCGNYG